MGLEGCDRTSSFRSTVVLSSALFCALLTTHSVFGQTIIYREGFNDDGDGSRYVIGGRGLVADGPDGMAVWDHSFDSGDFAQPAAAPAKRAAMLFEHDVNAELWTDESLTILDNLVDWALDGKEGARIYFLPLGFGDSSFLLFDRLQTRGHTVSDLELGAPIPNDADLVLNTSEERPNPLSLFVGAEVPLISFNARGHDSALVVTRGASTRFQYAISVNVVEENASHPILGGLSGTVDWTTEAPSSSVRGLGPRFAPGGKLLATYEDPESGEALPALVVVEKGDELLGTFNPSGGEGSGFVLGADLNLDFGGFPSSEDQPKSIQLAPVDVSQLSDVQLTVALAASEFDMDATDFLRVMVDINDSGDFITLSEFRGNERYLFDDGVVQLTASEFTDATWDIPDQATSLVVRFEAHSSFPNEQMAIDDVRITIPGIPGDFNSDGILDSLDADELVTQILSGANDMQFDQNADAVVNGEDLRIWVKDVAVTWFGDADLDGLFDSGDLVAVFQSGKYETAQPAGWVEGDWNADGRFDSGDLVAAFQDGGYELGPRDVANAVPEPTSLVILTTGLIGLAMRRRGKKRGQASFCAETSKCHLSLIAMHPRGGPRIVLLSRKEA